MEEPNRIRNHNEETNLKPSALEMQPLPSNITKNAIEMEEHNRSQIAGPVPNQEDRVDFKKERGTNHKVLNDEERDTSKRATDWRMDYEVFQWIFIIVFTLIAVIDRYTTNYWPLWVDSPGPTIPGNVGVTIFRFAFPSTIPVVYAFNNFTCFIPQHRLVGIVKDVIGELIVHFLVSKPRVLELVH